jgi:hypothetical protein
MASTLIELDAKSATRMANTIAEARSAPYSEVA